MKQRSILIGSRTYKLFFVTDNELRDKLFELTNEVHHDKLGFSDHHNLQIYVRDDVHEDVFKDAIVHEILHAILDDAGTSSFNGNTFNDFNEVVASILAPRLVKTLKDVNTIIDEFK